MLTVSLGWECQRDRGIDFVLVHGTTQSPAGWARLAGELAVRGHRPSLSISLTSTRHRRSSATALTSLDPGWIGADPTADVDVARRFLFHDCDEATTEWALSTVRPFFSETVYHEVVPLMSGIPAMVIVPKADRTIRFEWSVVPPVSVSMLNPSLSRGGIARTCRVPMSLRISSCRRSDGWLAVKSRTGYKAVTDCP